MSAGRACGAAMALAIALGLGTPAAWAEPRDPARADALFREGRDAMKQRDYETACARFGESQSLDPAPGTLLNLADCEEKLGRLVAAHRHVQGALAELPQRDDRARIAKERLAALDHRVAHVTLRVAPGTPTPFRVTRDGAEVGPTELGAATRMDPGSHAFVLTLSDGRDRRLGVVLREGDTKEIVLEMAESAPTPPPPPPPPPPVASSVIPPARSAPPPPPAPSAATSRGAPTAAYVAGGIGVVGLIVAGVTGSVLAHRKSIVDGDCDRAARTCATDDGVNAAHTGKSLVPVFYGAAIVGFVGLATGAVILLARDDDKPSLGVFVGPMTLDVRGRF